MRRHWERAASRCSNSGPVRVMSPAPIVITTSPARTYSANASARSERAPCQITGCPLRCIGEAIISELTPGMGSSRAGYMSARNTLSAADRASPNAAEKSRVREKRWGWNATTIRRPGYDACAACSVAAISVRLEIVPQRRESVDLQPPDDLTWLEIMRSPDLDAADAEKRHLSRGRARTPGGGHDDTDEKKGAKKLPAWFSESLGGDHSECAVIGSAPRAAALTLVRSG